MQKENYQVKEAMTEKDLNRERNSRGSSLHFRLPTTILLL